MGRGRQRRVLPTCFFGCRSLFRRIVLSSQFHCPSCSLISPAYGRYRLSYISQMRTDQSLARSVFCCCLFDVQRTTDLPVDLVQGGYLVLLQLPLPLLQLVKVAADALPSGSVYLECGTRRRQRRLPCVDWDQLLTRLNLSPRAIQLVGQQSPLWLAASDGDVFFFLLGKPNSVGEGRFLGFRQFL